MLRSNFKRHQRFELRHSNFHRNKSFQSNLRTQLIHQTTKPQDEYPETNDLQTQPTKLSNLAKLAFTRISIVKLPTTLVEGVQSIINSIKHKSTIRTSAQSFYSRYRLLSSQDSINKSKTELRLELEESKANPNLKQNLETTIKPKLKTNYDHLETISFSAGVMPSTYGATLRVLIEFNQKLLIQKRLDFDHDESIKIIDFGSGTGAVAWAAKEVWKELRIDYYGLEKSSSMIWLSDHLLNPTNELNSGTSTTESNLNNPIHDDSMDSNSKLKTSFHRLSISPHKSEHKKNRSTEDKLLEELDKLDKEEKEIEKVDEIESKITDDDTLSSIQSKIKNKQNLIAIMSFTLSDLPNEESRRQAILQLWKTGAKTMIIIDRGTPSGFQLISMARQQLLNLGKRSSVAEDSSWILAPCSHDLTCPLIGSKHFCHFSQRIQRPKFLKVTKHTLVDEEDCKFSYVIVRRGSRDECKFDESKLGLDDQVSEVNDHQTGSRDQVIESNQVEDHSVERIRTNPINWPRIILPPHKKKGHVILDVCSSNGQIERMTIPKSQGKSDYYDARKSHWGDSWPHGSKKVPLIKEIKKVVKKSI